ncbi:MAG: TonB-dependent receptor plug domain-containing protein, partial [Gammaproteobacteria bacterium]
MPGVAVRHAYARDEAVALNRLSLEELGEVEVISVSKEPLPVRDAAASVYVITRQEILRSGATSLFEALRLAPNLLVTQLSASDYALSARGFGGNPDAQNFANKLLVLIDGRSVYSPLFSGVYADAQDVLLEDVERIEVNAGPGATLWGANAMNGVVNIVTRPAIATQGQLVALGAGNREQHGSFRHGGRIGEAASYRVYGKAFARGETETPAGLGRDDEWYRGQGGFRIDWTQGDDDL